MLPVFYNDLSQESVSDFSITAGSNCSIEVFFENYLPLQVFSNGKKLIPSHAPNTQWLKVLQCSINTVALSKFKLIVC